MNLCITHQNVGRQIQFTPQIKSATERERSKCIKRAFNHACRLAASKYTELLFCEAFPDRILSLLFHSILYDRN